MQLAPLPHFCRSPQALSPFSPASSVSVFTAALHLPCFHQLLSLQGERQRLHVVPSGSFTSCGRSVIFGDRLFSGPHGRISLHGAAENGSPASFPALRSPPAPWPLCSPLTTEPLFTDGFLMCSPIHTSRMAISIIYCILTSFPMQSEALC